MAKKKKEINHQEVGTCIMILTGIMLVIAMFYIFFANGYGI